MPSSRFPMLIRGAVRSETARFFSAEKSGIEKEARGKLESDILCLLCSVAEFFEPLMFLFLFRQEGGGAKQCGQGQVSARDLVRNAAQRSRKGPWKIHIAVRRRR